MPTPATKLMMRPTRLFRLSTAKTWDGRQTLANYLKTTPNTVPIVIRLTLPRLIPTQQLRQRFSVKRPKLSQMPLKRLSTGVRLTKVLTRSQTVKFLRTGTLRTLKDTTSLVQSEIKVRVVPATLFPSLRLLSQDLSLNTERRFQYFLHNTLCNVTT